MPELLFLSEYLGDNKRAWVCRDPNTGKFVAIGYNGGQERCKESFDIESDAEDWAEDWVLLTIPE